MSVIQHLDGHKLVHIDPSHLKPHPDNPRTHSKEQVKKIAASIKRFGFRNPGERFSLTDLSGSSDGKEQDRLQEAATRA